MNRNVLTKAMAVGVLVGACGLALNVSANHHEGEDRPERGERMVELLKLDDQQRSLFNEMRSLHHPKGKDKRMDEHQALIQLAQQERFDRASAQAMADKIGSEASHKALQHAEAYHAFYRSLSDEQRTTFDALHEVRRANMENKMKKGGGKHDKEHGEQHHGMHD
ncbi:MAG: motif family protein [Pseudomonadota bacterium]